MATVKGVTANQAAQPAVTNLIQSVEVNAFTGTAVVTYHSYEGKLRKVQVPTKERVRAAFGGMFEEDEASR